MPNQKDLPRVAFRKTLLATFIIVGFVSIGLIVWLRVTTQLKIPPLPVPNGYTYFRSASVLIVGDAPGPKGDVRKADEASLSTFVTNNRAAIEIARQGLAQKSQVPLSAEPDTLQEQIANHLSWSSDIRKLARLMISEARLARMEGRREDALRTELEIVDLGQAASRGGMVIDHQVGLAISSSGLELLRDNQSGFTSAETQQVLRHLVAFNARREPVSEVLAREQALGKTAGGWQVRVLATFTGTFDSHLQSAFDATGFADKRVETGVQLLIGELAIQIFRDQHGRWPNTLDELVPSPLQQVPIDPFSFLRQPLRYRKNSTGGLLYSVGPDEQDDGGRPIQEFVPSAQGDIPLKAW